MSENHRAQKNVLSDSFRYRNGEGCMLDYVSVTLNKITPILNSAVTLLAGKKILKKSIARIKKKNLIPPTWLVN